MKSLILFLIGIGSVSVSVAGEKFFAFAAPNAATSPEGLFQIAVFGERDAAGRVDYNYYISKFDSTGKLYPISEPLNAPIHESPDLRGYGIANASWSMGERNGGFSYSDIVNVEIVHRKFSDLEILRRDSDGIYRHIKFEISKYIDLGAIDLWVALKAKGYIEGSDTAFWGSMSLELTQGDGNRRLGNAFLTNEKMQLTYKGIYFVTAKDGSGRKDASATVTVKLELDMSNYDLQVKVLSKAVVIE